MLSCEKSPYSQASTQYEPKKTKALAKKRKNVRTQAGNQVQRSSGDSYRFSCDHCALTFIDPKEAIEHISQTHMPSKTQGQAGVEIV